MTEPNTLHPLPLAVRQIRCLRLICGLRRPQRCTRRGRPPKAPGSEPGWGDAVLEKLAMASLAEQRAARRWKIFFGSMWLLLVVAIFSGERCCKGSPSANKERTAYSGGGHQG